MKKLKRRLFKLIVSVFSFLLGFSGMTTACIGGMYGTLPFEGAISNSDFNFTGRVTDSTSGKAISGIKVDLIGLSEKPSFTDSEGYYSLICDYYDLYDFTTVKLTFHDVDGDSNGSYQNKTVSLIVNPDYADDECALYVDDFSKNLDVDLTDDN